MKQLFLFLLVANMCFAGRKIFLFDAHYKLHEIKCRMLQIRTHLGYQSTLEEYMRINDSERNKYYEQFDLLWQEFVDIKPFLQRELSLYAEKIALVTLALLMRKDKDRYARERRSDAQMARIMQRLSLREEELTQ